MYDAFRLGIEKNNEDKEPDYDIVLQSKRQKGYNAQGFLPKGDNEKSIETYFNNQEPLRTGIFKERMDQLKTHLTPGPQAAVLPAAAPGAVAAVASGAPNYIGPGSGTNMVQVNHAAGTNLAMAMNVASSAAATTSNPLGQASMQTPASNTNQSSMFGSLSGIFAPLSGYMNASPSTTGSMSTQSPATAYKTQQKSMYNYIEDTGNVTEWQRKSNESMMRAKQKNANITF